MFDVAVWLCPHPIQWVASWILFWVVSTMCILELVVGNVVVPPFAQKALAKKNINVRSSSAPCLSAGGVCKTCGSKLLAMWSSKLKQFALLQSWRVKEVHALR